MGNAWLPFKSMDLSWIRMGKSRRVRRFQLDEATNNENKNEASTKRTSGDTQVAPMHVDAAVFPGTVAQMQNNGLNIHAAEFVPRSKTGNDAKVYQAVDSSGTDDRTETLSPGEAVLSDVREGVSKTDEREIAGDYDEDHHESDVFGLEQSEPKQNEQLEAEASRRPRRRCNFEEDGDEPDMHDDFYEGQRNVRRDRMATPP